MVVSTTRKRSIHYLISFKVIRWKLPLSWLRFYGLRREEIIGLKWTAIDFENNTLTIQHTVTECNLDGKHIEVASDTAKTDSSLRTMPLVTNFREMLLAEKREAGTLSEALWQIIL